MQQVSIWRENMLRYLSADIVCSKSLVESIVFIILQIFFTTRGICQSVICQSRECLLICQLFQNPPSFYIQISLKSKACVWGKSTTFERKRNFFNSVKDKSKMQVVDKITGNLTTFQEQDQSEKLLSNAFRKMWKPE